MLVRPSTPYTEAELQAIAERVLARAGADACEVTVACEQSALTRFANSQIHQNVAEDNLTVRVRLAFGQKVASGSTNDLSDEGLARMLADATALARFQPDNPDFVGFTAKQRYAAVDALNARTLGFSPADRAETVGAVCRQAAAQGLSAAGAFTTGVRQVAIANSLGLWAHHAHSLADFNTVVMADEGGSGWASAAGLDAGAIDGTALGASAIDKALRSRRPEPIAPGDYTVILEEDAVLEMLQYLSGSMTAEAVYDGRSWMADREGEPIVDPRVSLWDDGHDLAGIPLPFDAEGMPKRRVELIREGRIGTPVSDRHFAKLMGGNSTGHATGGWEFGEAGPRVTNLFMATGDATKQQMLESTERGIWVSRFHYVNTLDSRKTTITGMTRDGTFWIEDGKLVRPLQNLRFTQSILEAFKAIAMVGRDGKLELNWWGGGNRAPALKIDRFHFSGATTF